MTLEHRVQSLESTVKALLDIYKPIEESVGELKQQMDAVISATECDACKEKGNGKYHYKFNFDDVDTEGLGGK
jgi:hypothetical protein